MYIHLCELTLSKVLDIPRWPSFSGRRCSCLEQSPWSCHVCTLRVAVLRSRLKTHLFNISYPSPLWLYTVPAQWRLVTLDTLIVLACLLAWYVGVDFALHHHACNARYCCAVLSVHLLFVRLDYTSKVSIYTHGPTLLRTLQLIWQQR